MKSKNIFVEVFVFKEHCKKSVAISLLRKFVQEPIATISQKIDSDEAVYQVNLIADQFYSGLEDLMKLVNGLQDSGVNFGLKINGVFGDCKYMDDVYKKLKNINLKDFR